MTANPITSSSPSASSNPAIDAAAVKPSAAAYPFIKDIDWTDSRYSKPIPRETPLEMMKAVDKVIPNPVAGPSQQMTPQRQGAVPAAPGNPLSATALAAASPAVQKQMTGEQLFASHSQVPTRTGGQ